MPDQFDISFDAAVRRGAAIKAAARNAERQPDTLPQALRSLAVGMWWIILVALLPTRRLKAWAEEHIEALVDAIEERRCSR